MSITSARNFIEKSGCGLAVGVGLVIVITLGLVQYSGCGQQQAEAPVQAATPVAKLNGQIVALNQVEQRYEAAASQILNVEGGAPLDRVAEVYAGALELEIRTVAQREVARKRGVQVTAQKILDQFAREFDNQLAQQRAMMTAMGQIKPNATEAEVQTELAKALGVPDIAKARADVLKRAEEALQRPNERARMENEAVAPILVESVAAQTNITDDQLKKDQAKYVTKRIAFNPFAKPDEDLKAKAEKVLAEIKGGLSFEAAMDKYSDDPAPGDKKKKSEATVDLTRAVLTYDDSYKPLLEMKPGDISPIIQLNTGPAIFKLIRIDEKVPANFEATKADLKKNRVREIAIKTIQREIDDLVNSSALTWESDGFKILHDWLKAKNDPELGQDKAKLNARFGEIAKAAEEVVDAAADTVGLRAAQLAFFASIDPIYDDAKGNEKSALLERWAKAAEGALATTENVGLRLEMAEALLAANNKEQALQALLMASHSNSGFSDAALENYKKIGDLSKQMAGQSEEDLNSLKESLDAWKRDAASDLMSRAEFNEDYTEGGRTVYAEVGQKSMRYRALGIITEEEAKKIDGFQAKWRQNKLKADDEAAKEAERQKAELKKAEDEAKKASETKSGDTKAGDTKAGESKLPSSSDLLNPTKGG